MIAVVEDNLVCRSDLEGHFFAFLSLFFAPVRVPVSDKLSIVRLNLTHGSPLRQSEHFSGISNFLILFHLVSRSEKLKFVQLPLQVSPAPADVTGPTQETTVSRLSQNLSLRTFPT